MTRREFKKILRGDVLSWTGQGPPNTIGLVRRVDDGTVHIVWEDGLDGMYKKEDAKNLEHGP